MLRLFRLLLVVMAMGLIAVAVAVSVTDRQLELLYGSSVPSVVRVLRETVPSADRVPFLVGLGVLTLALLLLSLTLRSRPLDVTSRVEVLGRNETPGMRAPAPGAVVPSSFASPASTANSLDLGQQESRRAFSEGALRSAAAPPVAEIGKADAAEASESSESPSGGSVGGLLGVLAVLGLAGVGLFYFMNTKRSSPAGSLSYVCPKCGHEKVYGGCGNCHSKNAYKLVHSDLYNVFQCSVCDDRVVPRKRCEKCGIEVGPSFFRVVISR